MSPEVKATFRREGPLSINHFRKVHSIYELPMPEFDDSKTRVCCVKDDYGNYIIGQFDRNKYKVACGIARKFNYEGEYLAEYFMLG